MLTKQELDNIRAATEPWKGIADVQAPVDVSELLALLDHIAAMEENATAQALALKAANERADANERDAERYRWLREQASTIQATEAWLKWEWGGCDYGEPDYSLDDFIDAAMSNL